MNKKVSDRQPRDDGCFTKRWSYAPPTTGPRPTRMCKLLQS